MEKYYSTPPNGVVRQREKDIIFVGKINDVINKTNIS